MRLSSGETFFWIFSRLPLFGEYHTSAHLWVGVSIFMHIYAWLYLFVCMALLPGSKVLICKKVVLMGFASPVYNTVLGKETYFIPFKIKI